MKGAEELASRLPVVVAEEYFNQFNAPRKKTVWFENSAHFAFYEEPERFTQEMKTVLLETNGKAQDSR